MPGLLAAARFWRSMPVVAWRGESRSHTVPVLATTR